MPASFALLAAAEPRHSLIPAWFVALVYLALVAMCLWLWRRDRNIDRLRRPPGLRLWLGLAIFFAALGVGKLFDAQAALTDLLRKEAIQEDWYHFRQPVQIGVVVALAAGTVLGTFALGRLAARGKSRRDLAVLAPVILLLGFYAIRGTSWHFVDVVLFRFVAGTRINTWAELMIQGLIAAALLDRAGQGRKNAASPDQRKRSEGEDEAVVASVDGPGPASF